MRHLIASQSDRLIDLLVAATILTGFVALAMLASPQPARRLRLARLGLIGLLFLPMLDQVASLPDINLGPFVAFAFRTTGSWISGQGVGSSVGLADSAHLPLLSLTRNRTQSWPEPPTWLGWLYAAGLVVLAGRLALGALMSRWLKAATLPVPQPLGAHYLSLPFGGEHRPEIRISERIRRPVLLGVFEPLILIPQELAEGPLDTIMAVLTHELAHAQESDISFSLLAECLLVLAYPVLPLWWIGRQMRLDQELLADARTVENLGDPAAYASSLLAFVGPRAPGTPLLRVEGTSTNGPPRDGSNLYRRILLILVPPLVIEHHPPLGWLARRTALVFGLTLLLSVINFRPESEIETKMVVRFPAREAYRISALMLPGPGSTQLLEPGFRRYRLEGKMLLLGGTLSEVTIAGIPIKPLGGINPVVSPWVGATTYRFRLDVAHDHYRLVVADREVGRCPKTTGSSPLGLAIAGEGVVLWYDMTATETHAKKTASRP